MAIETSTPKPIIKAASACVWRGDEVLLAQRGKTWGRGYWALPGGRIEPGENAVEAAHRELLEETGVSAALRHFVGDFTLEGPDVTYTIACWSGLFLSGEASPASDAIAVQWIDFRKTDSLKLAFNNVEAIARARALLAL